MNMPSQQDIQTALSAEQLAVQELYADLLAISVAIFGGLSPENALVQRYNAYLKFTRVVELHKSLTQSSTQEAQP